MHKPLSPKRAGMFLNAAIRSHVERREGRASDPLLPLVRELRSRVDPRKWLFVSTGLALFLALLAVLLVARHGSQGAADPAAAATSVRPAPAPGPQADPVLSRARAALAAGRYDAPPGRNALDLYSAVVLVRPDDAEARNGLEATIGRLLEKADRAAADGDEAEARRLAGRVLQVDAGHAGARAVLASLTPGPRPAAVPHAPPPSEPTPAHAAERVVAPSPRLAATAPARVQPDPLTPRIVGPGTLPTSPSRPPRQGVQRSFGAPVSSGHPTAGYVRRMPDVVTGTAPAAELAPTAVAAMPTRDLEPVSTPDPTYPPGAFRQRIEGWVEVEFTVTERGTTRDVEVVGAEPRGVFDAAAAAAVAGWNYRPRIVNGQPVAERSSVTLRFNVED
jgi:protein TonB